jgi:ABC-type amino acid transport substrate-binding protein
MAQAEEPAYDRVIKSGTLRCSYAISPPLLVMDPNTKQLSGFNYDLVNALGKDLGLTVEWSEEVGWGNFIEGLNTARYDAFCGLMWPDPARMKFISLIGPVMYDFVEAYVRADDTRFDGDLTKLNSPEVTIPVVEGDVSVALARSLLPNAKHHSLPQTSIVSDMFMAVESRKADVIMVTPGMFKTFEAASPGKLKKLPDVPPSTVYSSYLGVGAGEYRLRDMLAVALRGMIDDGRLRRLADKYDPSLILPKAGY